MTPAVLSRCKSLLLCVGLTCQASCSKDPELPAEPTPPMQPATSMALSDAATEVDDALTAHLARRFRERALAAAVTPTTAPAGPAALPDAVTPDGGRDALIWQSQGAQAVTAWVRWEPGKPPTVLAQRRGVWAFGRGDIWGWRVRRRMVRVCDAGECAQADGVCAPGSAEGGPLSGRLDEVAWVGLLGGKQYPVGPVLPKTVAVDLGTPGLHRWIELLGQAEQRVLVRVVTETMSCGAMNGGSAEDVRLVALPTGAWSDPWVMEDEALMTEAHRDDLAAVSVGGDAVTPPHLQALHLHLSTLGQWSLETEWLQEPKGDARPDQGARVRIAPRQLPGLWQEALADAPKLSGAALAPPAGALAVGETHAGWSWLQRDVPRARALARFSAAATAP